MRKYNHSQSILLHAYLHAYFLTSEHLQFSNRNLFTAHLSSQNKMSEYRCNGILFHPLRNNVTSLYLSKLVVFCNCMDDLQLISEVLR